MISIQLQTYTSDPDRGNLLFEDSSSIYEIGDVLIDDDIVIDETVEFEDAFVFSSSTASLRFIDDGRASFDFFKMENGFGNKNKWIGIKIIKDEVTKFWGFVEPESYQKDRLLNEFSFLVVDWAKWLYTNLAEVPVAHPYSLSSLTLEHLLLINYGCDVITGFKFVTGDISTTLDLDDYEKLSLESFKRDMLMTEIQKHYGGFFFVDPSGVLTLINRGYQESETPINITDDILDDDFLLNGIIYSEYDSLLISVSGGWRKLSTGFWSSYEGWGFVRYNTEQNRIRVILANANLGNIPHGMNYFDLRQKMNPETKVILGVDILAVSSNTLTVSHSYYPIDDSIKGLVLAWEHGFGRIGDYTVISDTETQLELVGYFGADPSGFGNPSGKGNMLKMDFNNNSFDYMLFSSRDAEVRWKDYKTILFNQKKNTVPLNRTDIQMFQRVDVGDTENYVVMRKRENLRDNTSVIDIYSLPNVEPEV